MPNREAAYAPEVSKGKERAPAPPRAEKKATATERAETLRELEEARRLEAAEEGGRVAEIRQRIGVGDVDQAWSAVSKAESLLLSDDVNEQTLEQTEADLRRGLDIAESTQMELQGSPDTEYKMEMMKKNRELISKLENLVEISGLNPVDAKHEYLLSKKSEHEKANRKDLATRHHNLQTELAKVNDEVETLEKKIEKSGIYGKGVSADELSSPAAGVFSRFRTGLIDAWRGITGQEAMLTRLRELHAKQNKLVENISFAEEVAPVEVSAEETAIRRTKLRARKERAEVEKTYGRKAPAARAELEKEIAGEEVVEAEEKERAENKEIMREKIRAQRALEAEERKRLADEEMAKEIQRRAQEAPPKVHAPTKAEILVKAREAKAAKAKEEERLRLEADEKAAYEKAIQPSERLVKEREEAEKELSPMNINLAKDLVPEARDLWDLAAKQINAEPIAAAAMQGMGKFGASRIENNPATIFVYTIAKMKQAEQAVDKKLADKYYSEVMRLAKAMRIENNALLLSSIARKPEVKNVLKGTQQRRAAVDRSTARWKT